MNYQELLSSGANVSITVNLKDLQDLFKEVVGNRVTEVEPDERDEFVSRKNALSLLQIDSSTLWNWERTGYIKSYPFGGRKRYKISDIELIKSGKK